MGPYIVALIIALLIFSRAFYPEKRDKSNDRPSPSGVSRPQSSGPDPLWSKEEERETAAEINRLVAEFLEDCKQRNSVGRTDLAFCSRRMCVRGAVDIQAYCSINGHGWFFSSSYVNCGFAVSNDGKWCYVGCYTVETHHGQKEICQWTAYNLGDGASFDNIDLLEFRYLIGKGRRETNTAEPADALNIASVAIEEWRASFSSGPNRTS